MNLTYIVNNNRATVIYDSNLILRHWIDSKGNFTLRIYSPIVGRY